VVDAIDIFRSTDLVTDPIKKKILDDNPRRLTGAAARFEMLTAKTPRSRRRKFGNLSLRVLYLGAESG
jgi:hypothetical protein